MKVCTDWQKGTNNILWQQMSSKYFQKMFALLKLKIKPSDKINLISERTRRQYQDKVNNQKFTLVIGTMTAIDPSIRAGKIKNNSNVVIFTGGDFWYKSNGNKKQLQEKFDNLNLTIKDTLKSILRIKNNSHKLSGLSIQELKMFDQNFSYNFEEEDKKRQRMLEKIKSKDTFPQACKKHGLTIYKGNDFGQVVSTLLDKFNSINEVKSQFSILGICEGGMNRSGKSIVMVLVALFVALNQKFPDATMDDILDTLQAVHTNSSTYGFTFSPFSDILNKTKDGCDLSGKCTSYDFSLSSVLEKRSKAL